MYCGVVAWQGYNVGPVVRSRNGTVFVLRCRAVVMMLARHEGETVRHVSFLPRPVGESQLLLYTQAVADAVPTRGVPNIAYPTTWISLCKTPIDCVIDAHAWISLRKTPIDCVIDEHTARRPTYHCFCNRADILSST